MSALAELLTSLKVYDSTGQPLSVGPAVVRFTPGLGVGKRETVSLTGSAFTALTAPTGSKLVIILLPATATSCSLKSVTGDGTGLSIAPASNGLGLPLILPLGATPTLGVYNGGSTVACDVVWV